MNPILLRRPEAADVLAISESQVLKWTEKLYTRFLLMTNELPRIEDSSGALASRFVVLRLTESHYGREDHELFNRFVPELPGILNWALDGYDRLYARGRFTQPQTSATLIQEFEDLGSPIGAFIRDRCEVGKGFEVLQPKLYEAWQSWCIESGRERAGTVQSFGRDLNAALPWIAKTRPRVAGSRVWCYEGIRLREGHK